MKTKYEELPLIETNTNDTWADAVSGVYAHNGVLRMTLEKLRINYAPDATSLATRIAIGTIVLPATTARELATAILGVLDKPAAEAVNTPAEPMLAGRTIN